MVRHFTSGSFSQSSLYHVTWRNYLDNFCHSLFLFFFAIWNLFTHLHHCKTVSNSVISDLRCLPKLSFRDMESRIAEKWNVVCGGHVTKLLQNTMVHQKSYALHSEKGYIIKIAVVNMEIVDWDSWKLKKA